MIRADSDIYFDIAAMLAAAAPVGSVQMIMTAMLTPSQMHADSNTIRSMTAGRTLDEDRAETRHVFRLKGYSIALIVSGKVKRRIEAVGAVGLSFERIHGAWKL